MTRGGEDPVSDAVVSCHIMVGEGDTSRLSHKH